MMTTLDSETVSPKYSELIHEIKSAIESQKIEFVSKLEETEKSVKNSLNICIGLEHRIKELETNNQLVIDELQRLRTLCSDLHNDGSSAESKSTSSEDNSDEDINNNYREPTTPPNPVVTNHYSYDQRVYNRYKLDETQHKSSGVGVFGALRIFDWKYDLIALALVICTAALLCYSDTDLLDWFVFHKVFGYIFNDHFDVIRAVVPI